MFLSLYFLIVPVTARFLQTAYIDKDKIVHYTKEAVMRTVRLYHPVLKQNQDCFFVAFLRLKTGSAFMQGFFYGEMPCIISRRKRLLTARTF